MEIKWQVMAAKCGSPNPAVDFPPTCSVGALGSPMNRHSGQRVPWMNVKTWGNLLETVLKLGNGWKPGA